MTGHSHHHSKTNRIHSYVDKPMHSEEHEISKKEQNPKMLKDQDPRVPIGSETVMTDHRIPDFNFAADIAPVDKDLIVLGDEIHDFVRGLDLASSSQVGDHGVHNLNYEELVITMSWARLPGKPQLEIANDGHQPFKDDYSNSILATWVRDLVLRDLFDTGPDTSSQRTAVPQFRDRVVQFSLVMRSNAGWGTRDEEFVSDTTINELRGQQENAASKPEPSSAVTQKLGNDTVAKNPGPPPSLSISQKIANTLMWSVFFLAFAVTDCKQ